MFLFVFYLGGNAGQSNIEVHDIQFVAAQTPEEAWPVLREAWFGDPDKVHIDGYARLLWADGYSVHLRETPPEKEAPRLYFVNMGGYHPDSLADLHAFDFFVAKDAKEAKVRGLASLLKGVRHQHKDNLKEVDDCLLLETVSGLYVHLVPDSEGSPFRPQWQGYQPIGR